MQFHSAPLAAQEPAEYLKLVTTVYAKSLAPEKMMIVFFILAYLGVRRKGKMIRADELWPHYVAAILPEFDGDLAECRRLFDSAWQMVERIICDYKNELMS